MRILITGATGFVGSWATARLALEHEVVAIVRTPSALPVRVTPIIVQDWTPAVLAEATKGMDAVLHTAAVAHRRGPVDDERVKFNVVGTQMLLEAAIAQSVPRFVFTSSIKVHGESPPSPIDEHTKVAPDSVYGKAKADAEALVLRAIPKFARGAIAIRLCPVFGPGDKGNVRNMLAHLRKHRLVVAGSGDVRKSLVHVRTVAEAIALAVTSKTSGAMPLANRPAPSVQELANWMAILAHRAKPPHIPATVLRAASLVVDQTFALARKSPIDARALVHKSQVPTECVPSKIERELGISTDLDFLSAIREELGSLQASGYLR